MKALLICLFLFFSNFLYSQCGTVAAKISSPNRDVNMSAFGHIFTEFVDGSYSDSHYIFDNDTLLDLGNSKGVWIGGYNTKEDATVCATSYTVGWGDYYPGPIRATTGEPYDDTYCNWDKTIWTFSGSKLSYLKSRFDNSDLVESDIPVDLWSYPARGNNWYLDNFNFIIEEDVAPFWDRNFDNIYNPMDGDLPIPLQEAPSFFPFQFSYTVINDLSGPHIVSQGYPMSVQLQMINYLVNSDSNDLANASVFTRLICTNKGFETYTDAKIGMHEDVSYGFGADDYTACFPDLNTTVVYGKEFDSTTTIGLQTERAVHFTKVLNADLYSHIVHGTANLQNNTNVIDPTLVKHYLSMLNGFWHDDTPITRGGIGYDTLSTDETKFAFDGCPLDTTAWSMVSAQLRFDDYRSLVSIDLGTFSPGDEKTIDMVETIVYDPNTADYEIVCNIEPYVNDIEKYYSDIVSGVITNVNVIGFINDIKIIENPVNNNIKLEYEGQLDNVQLNIFDSIGKIIYSKNNPRLQSRIDVSHLAQGIYFLQLSGNNLAKTIKFIKK